MRIEDGLNSLNLVGTAAGLKILGPPDGIFHRLAMNRHRAAHSFGLDYRIQDLFDDLNSGLPLVAFSFDTCISQCAYSIKNSVQENKSFTSFNANEITLRRFEFNATTAKWQEFRGNNHIQDLAKGGLEKRLQRFKKDNLAAGETILIKGGNGGIQSWIQPI